MRVRLLGTGSADGWPNAFCECASCLLAVQNATLRSPTSALVDGTVLLDCGPETPRAALRYADGLAGVTHALITHDHPARSAPTALLARTLAGRNAPLTVIGPSPVVASWRRWVEPSSTVAFKTVAAGDELSAGPYTVRVLAAGRGDTGPQAQDAVVYDVTGPDGSRLLYATDTGPLPEQTQSATTGAGYDLVLVAASFGGQLGLGRPLERLDPDGLAAELRAARASGAVTDRTQVVAVHLSHHSPPDLQLRLARWGARAVPDGTELVLGAGTSPARDLAPRRTLVLGGARSGKSAAAERLLLAEPAVTYVATGSVPGEADPEWSARVQLHRDRRPGGWNTCETTDLASALREATQPLLVDSLTAWLTAVLDAAGAWDEVEGWRGRVEVEVDDLVAAWNVVTVAVVAVSDEVGSGVVPATASGRLFRDLLGRLNARVGEASERVLLVVAGREIDLSSPEPKGYG